MAVIVKGTVVNSAPVFKVLKDVHGCMMIPYPGGIPCHEEEPGEPCGCNQSQCGNPSGRYRSLSLVFSNSKKHSGPGL